MATTQVSPNVSEASPPTSSRNFSALDVIMLVALLIAAIDYVAAALPSLMQGHLIPPAFIAVGYLVATGIMATRWRWAMLVALLVGLASLVLHLGPGFPLFVITHPTDEHSAFPLIVVQPPLMLMVVVASLVKLVQTLRRQPAHAPRWLAPGIGALVGLALGALLIGAVAQPGTAGGAATTTGKGTEVVHLTGATFAPDIIALHTGDTLTVVDDAPVPHILTNGSWSASNQAMPSAEPGAPLINNVNLNGNTVTIGPFTTAGTYHIFCTVHPGMNLTVVVQ